jgi:hypothetical protein
MKKSFFVMLSIQDVSYGGLGSSFILFNFLTGIRGDTPEKTCNSNVLLVFGFIS